jgi:hypothetical protein
MNLFNNNLKHLAQMMLVAFIIVCLILTIVVIVALG